MKTPSLILLFLALPVSCGGGTVDADQTGGEGGSDHPAGDGDGDATSGGNSGDGDGDGDGEPQKSCAETCRGCCMGETCIEEDNRGPEACGSLAGDRCVVCENFETCDLFTGTCELDPEGLWEVRIESVSMHPVNENGEGWDLFDDPDISVCLVVDGQSRGCTSECTDALNCDPGELVGTISHEDFFLGFNSYRTLPFLHVYDLDGLDGDDAAGEVSVSYFDLAPGTFSSVNEEAYGYASVTYSLTPLP